MATRAEQAATLLPVCVLVLQRSDLESSVRYDMAAWANTMAGAARRDRCRNVEEAHIC